MNTKVRLSLHDRKQPSFTVEAYLARVPVAGDVIHHDATEYVVSTVVLYTSGDLLAYVVAKVPLIR